MFSGLMSVCTRLHSSCRYCKPRRTCLAMLLTTQGGTPFLRFFSMRESRFAPRGSKVIHMWVVEETTWVKESRKETIYALPG
jgi:hypothetical protein